MKTKLTPIAVLLFSLTILSPLYAGKPLKGEPIPGAEIYVELEDDSPITATTSEKGTFTFEGLKPGTTRSSFDCRKNQSNRIRTRKPSKISISQNRVITIKKASIF